MFIRRNHVLVGLDPFLQGCSDAADAVPPGGLSRNLEFVHGAGVGSLTLHQGHRVIFNDHQLMPERENEYKVGEMSTSVLVLGELHQQHSCALNQ